MVAEAFRTFRTNLFLSAPVEQQRVLLITSPKPEEGKTSVATNLAISIGQSGRRVLLVDANFHRPALGELFAKDHKEGLSNILIGHRQLDGEIVIRSDMPHLDVLTSGPIPPNPAELLSSPYMKTFLDQAKEQYDQVIIDGPPVLLLSDAMVMADIVDGVILVCRAKVSQRGAVSRAREQLGRVNGHILGAVLNAAQISRGGYFREQMRNYYDYQPTDALTVQTASRPLPVEEEGQDEDVDVIDPVDERPADSGVQDVDPDIELQDEEEDFDVKLGEDDLGGLIDDEEEDDDRPASDDPDQKNP
jgi:capsular exopolysaccharide synthesis family protein